jgi:hypothetical protein
LEDSYSIAYDDYNDEYDIFSPPTIEEKTRYDYNMPPMFDNYGDKNDYVHVGSINPFMQVARDKNVLCDIYIVNSIHDATESYYERGKHGFMHLNLYYWFLVGEATLPLHHLISDFAPTRPGILQPLPPQSYECGNLNLPRDSRFPHLCAAAASGTHLAVHQAPPPPAAPLALKITCSCLPAIRDTSSS